MRRVASFTKDDVSRAVKGALAGGIQLQEVHLHRDGSIVLRVAGQFGSDDDANIDAKLEAFARK